VPVSCPLVHRARTFSDVRAVLDGDNFTSACPEGESYSLGRGVLETDGAKHAAIHRIWSTWFSASQVVACRTSLIQPTVADAWRSLEGRGRVDLITEFAGEVAPRVIFGVIGLPPTVGSEIYRNSIVPIAVFRENHSANPREAWAAHARFVETLFAYEDLLCGSDRLPADITRAEFLDALAVVLQLATQTTVCAVANVFYLIAEYPESWAAVLDGHLAARHFLDEVIRFEPPSGGTFRFAKTDTRLPSGVELPQHAAVALDFHQANAVDPSLDVPEQWLPGVNRGVGTSFGFGRHACAGRSVALALLVAVVEELTRSRFSPDNICERGSIHGRIFRRPSRIIVIV
jgi:cytochrome P450